METTLYIWLIPALPLMGFLVISLFSKILSRRGIAITGVGSVSLSAIFTVIEGLKLLSDPGKEAITAHLYTWMQAGDFTADIALILDPLSLVFCFIITFVGALIHLYSVEYMFDDEGFARFFAYMNLFVGSMLILVLADNLLLMYMGWEGVGLCSYLLIGFWYNAPENGYAARKAFIVTRIGDTAMILGLFLLVMHFGTLNIRELMGQSSPTPVIAISAALLLGGALGKSAQLPLQTWLPDAMAGPSPVSALIHAATMVTAGVYLITRIHVIFILSPVVMAAVAIIGAVTLLVAGFSALAQSDLKRVLAYSTISQIGYMFLAMGIGAWSAAIFHFFIHAFFKALLFLSAGVVIHVLHEQNMFKMGGLYKKMPVVFYTFLAGGASLSALPLVTAGFYSKDQILWFGWASSYSNHWLWIAGITGAFITSLYTFRMIFLTFFGQVKTEPHSKPGKLMTIPMIMLAILSIAGGFIEMPENMGPVHLFSKLYDKVLPAVSLNKPESSEIIFQFISVVISLGGIYLAYLFFCRKSLAPVISQDSTTAGFFRGGWGFDRLYDTILVKPYTWLAEINKKDIVDRVYTGIAKITAAAGYVTERTQNGRLRFYVLILTAGLVVILAFMIIL